MATSSMTTGSTSGLGLAGLSSGLDTSGIITKLMAIEAQPQANLKTQLTGVTTYTNALQSLNSAIASVASNASSISKAGALAGFTATSDSAAATATATSAATAGSLSFSVTKLAQAQTSVTSAMTTWPDTTSATPSITIKLASGTTTTVTAASSNLDDVVAAINGGGTGVTATKVSIGTAASPRYVLQLSSSSTGAAGAFTVYQGARATTGAAMTLTQVAAAQDASLTLYAGTSAAHTVTSASNTFSALMTGVDVTVSAVTSTPVNLTVAADSSKVVAAASSLTTQMMALFSSISSNTAITTSSSTSGGTASSSTTGGVFTGDTAVRALNDTMLAAISGAVGTRSPSSIGIILTKSGTITFDQSAFTAAMASDPSGTMSMFQTISGRVATAATAASDPYKGSLTALVTSQQGQESTLTSQISDWDTRLATIQAQYQTQFNNLEIALNSLSSQSSYLTGQLSGLTTNYQNAT